MRGFFYVGQAFQPVPPVGASAVYVFFGVGEDMAFAYPKSLETLLCDVSRCVLTADSGQVVSDHSTSDA